MLHVNVCSKQVTFTLKLQEDGSLGRVFNSMLGVEND